MKRIFNRSYYYLVMMLYLCLTHSVFARDLESIATNLTSKTNRLVMALVPMGFGLSAVFMVFGNPRGAQMMSMTIMGGIVVLGGSSVFSWLKNIVG